VADFLQLRSRVLMCWSAAGIGLRITDFWIVIEVQALDPSSFGARAGLLLWRQTSWQVKLLLFCLAVNICLRTQQTGGTHMWDLKQATVLNWEVDESLTKVLIKTRPIWLGGLLNHPWLLQDNNFRWEVCSHHHQSRTVYFFSTIVFDETGGAEPLLTFFYFY
jgi:hypothetical protein